MQKGVFRRRAAAALLAVVVAGTAGTVYADRAPGPVAQPQSMPLRAAIRNSMPQLLEQAAPRVTRRAQGPYGRITRGPGQAKRAAFIAAGVIAGLYAGGYVGAKLEGNSCECDDPGLTGFLIGAPIGAIAGGLLGAALGSR